MALETVAWIATGLLATLYLMAASMKMLQPEKMQTQSKPLAELKVRDLRLIATAELVGVVGVLLPPAIDVMVWVAGVAAIGLGLIQVLAIPRHVRLKDTKGLPFNIVLLALAAFVALVRFGAFP